jgi:putative peptidoglycan lipid II flippase
VNILVAAALIIGLINNIAIAGMFGLDRRIDAYFAGLMLTNVLMWLIVDYLGKNFLPALAKRHSESRESASKLTSLLVIHVSLGAAVAAVLLIVLAPQIFKLILPGFDTQDIKLVTDMYVILAPSLVFMVIETFHAYVWQHRDCYSRVASARMALPLTLTVFIIGFGPVIGVSALPIGFLCGHIVCTVLLSYRVPYDFRLEFGFSDPDFRKILRNSVLLMSTGAFARSRSIIMQYFGSTLGEGAIAAIHMAGRFCEPVYQRAQIGIREIVFSQSARAVAKQNMRRFARLYNIGVAGILFVVTPIAAWYWVDAALIVDVIFGRGQFTGEMAELVTTALTGLVGSVIFFGVVQMLSNGFYAMDRIKVPLLIMPLGTVVYLVFAILLTPKFGIFGLTLALSISAMLLAGSLMLIFRLSVNKFALSAIIVAFLKYSLISVTGVLLARYFRALIGLDGIGGFLFSIVVIATVYGLLLLLSKDDMLLLILDKTGIKRGKKADSTR